MQAPKAPTDYRPLHGGLMLLCLPLPFLMPDPTHWPWPLLMPLLCYGAVVSAVPVLRRSATYLRLGRWNRGVLGATAAIVFLSTTALLLFEFVVRPDLQPLRVHFPACSRPWLILFGVFFCLLNALMEELVFRGILLDALESQVWPGAALVLQAAASGSAHVQGYPPGLVDAVLAGIYGLMLGGLRWLSGGLAAPVLAHVCADATILAIVVAGPTVGE